MSSNYDTEPLPPTEPWWPGIVALLVLAAIILAIVFHV